MRHTFFTDGVKKVICVSSFAGKKVRGTAVCSASDTFDLELGKKIAQARCDVRVAEKRMNRAQKRLDDAAVICNMAEANFDAAEDYFNDATDRLDEALAAHDELMAQFDRD